MVLICTIDFVAYDYSIPYDLENLILPAAILVYALWNFKKTIREIDQPDFFVKEKLMLVHVVIFVCFILV